MQTKTVTLTREQFRTIEVALNAYTRNREDQIEQAMEHGDMAAVAYFARHVRQAIEATIALQDALYASRVEDVA